MIVDKQEMFDLVSKAQGGDNNAFEKLFIEIQDNLYFYALKMIHNQQDAEDAVQSTAIEIFNSIGKLKNPEFFKTWAVRICHNVCCKQFKKNGLSTISVDDDESFIDDIADEDKESMPAELAESEEFKNIIEQMVDSLPDMQRSCLLLYYFEELDINEISEMLEIPTGTVKSNLNYARKKLKACVNDYEEENNIKLHSVGVLPLLWLLNKNVHVTFPVFKGASTMTTTVETAKSTVETIGHLGKLKSFLCTTAGKIIAVTTAAAIVVTGVVVNKISSEDDKTIVIVENDSSVMPAQDDNTISNNIYDYNLEFLGSRYSLPMSVSDFRSTGWVFDTFFDIHKEVLEAGKTLSYSVIKNQERISVRVINNTNDKLFVSESDIGELTFSFSNLVYYNDYSVTLAKSLEINNTTKYDEVIKKWGEATYFSSNSNGTVLKYEKSNNSFYFFNFDKNGRILYFIIRNWYTDS